MTDDELAGIAAHHWPGRPLATIKAELVVIRYTNHRGETADRLILPSGIRHDATRWHTECQWLLCAFDMEKRAWRDFAMKDIAGWRTPGAYQAGRMAALDELAAQAQGLDMGYGDGPATDVAARIKQAIESGSADAALAETAETRRAVLEALDAADRIDPEKLHRPIMMPPPA